MNKKNYIIAAAFLLFLSPALAEKSNTKSQGQSPPEPSPVRLSLQQAQTRALSNSQTLMAHRHKLAAVDAQVKQVFWAPFSGFSMNGFASVVPDRRIDNDYLNSTGVVRAPDNTNAADEVDFESSWGPTLKFEIKGGIPLYTFDKINSSRKAIKHARAAKAAEYPRFEHEILHQVAQAYEGISGAREMLYTIQQGSKHLKKARKKVESDLENQVGTSTEIDLIKLKVFESQVDNYQAKSLEIERVALAALRFLVGGNDRNRVDIIDAPQSVTTYDLHDLKIYKKQALDHRPELEALHYAVKAMSAKVAMRRADFWPDLLLIVGWRVGWTPGRPKLGKWFLKDNYNYGPGTPYFGLAVDYKLDLGLDIYRLDEAKAELAALSTEQKAALDGIMLEVEKTYWHAEGTRSSLNSMLQSKKLVKGWLTAVGQNHATGLASAKEVTDALKEYFQVMASLHTLTNDFNVATWDLKRVAGTIEQSNQSAPTNE